MGDSLETTDFVEFTGLMGGVGNGGEWFWAWSGPLSLSSSFCPSSASYCSLCLKYIKSLLRLTNTVTCIYCYLGHFLLPFCFFCQLESLLFHQLLHLHAVLIRRDEDLRQELLGFLYPALQLYLTAFSGLWECKPIIRMTQMFCMEMILFLKYDWSI